MYTPKYLIYIYMCVIAPNGSHNIFTLTLLWISLKKGILHQSKWIEDTSKQHQHQS